MKVGQLAKLLGVDPSTINRWTNEYSDFLSPKQGSQRQYTSIDVAIITTVAQLSRDGLRLDEIRLRLEKGDRVEHPNVLKLGEDTRLLPAGLMSQVIDTTELMVEIETLKSERDKLLELLETEQEENQELNRKLELASKEKEQLVAELNNEIKKLQRELGRAEGELEYRRSLDKRDRGE